MLILDINLHFEFNYTLKNISLFNTSISLKKGVGAHSYITKKRIPLKRQFMIST